MFEMLQNAYGTEAMSQGFDGGGILRTETKGWLIML
jgi:hypothetical protein